MAYSEHVRISFGGAIVVPGEPTEVWNCNVNGIGPEAGDPPAQMEAILAAIVPALSGWWASNTNKMASNARLDYVKVNAIGPDGTYVDKNTTHVHSYPGGTFGAGTPIHPSIISLCWSWTTAKSRGPGAHGRIYPPNYTVGTPGSLVVDGPVCASQANVAKSLLRIFQGFDGAGPEGITPVVASGKDGSLSPITGVSVGNVLDVQRRRKNKYNEVFSAVTYP